MLPPPVPNPQFPKAEAFGQGVVAILIAACALAVLTIVCVCDRTYTPLVILLCGFIDVLVFVHIFYLRLYKAVRGDPFAHPMATRQELAFITARVNHMTQDVKMQRREDAQKMDCPCPFLRTMYAEGAIPEIGPEHPMGYLSEQRLFHVLDWAGVSRYAFVVPSFTRKFHVSGIAILHLARNRPNDTGILHRGIGLHQRDQLLNRFLGFAKNGLFGMGELEALVDQNSVDFFGNESDLSATRGEMATILAVFGTYNNSLWRWMFGLKVITVDDVRALWIRHEFPQGWLNRREQETSYFSWACFCLIARFMCMGLLARRGVTTEEAPLAYTLFDPLPPAPEVPGGRLSLFDSRSGSLQEVPPNGFRWLFSENYWQVQAY